MDEELNLPQPFTTGSTALALPAPSVGTDLAEVQPMSPGESMMEIFIEIRDGINTLVDLFQGQILGGADEARDLELAAADTDVTDPGPPAEEPADTGGTPGERKIFNKANLKKALLLGGIASLFLFTEQIEKALAPILKFIKEKVLPNALDIFYDVIESVGNLFSDLGDRFGVLFSEDATWWERIQAFLGIFKDIGKFFFDIFDTLATNILEMFGVDFAPYDGLGSYIIGKTKEGFQAIIDFFTATGEFILEGAGNIWDWITGKVSSAFQSVKDFFVATGEFLIGGFNSISDWISDKLAAPFKFLTDLFSFSEEDATAGGIATKLIDLIALPFNLAVNFIKGLFGFGADEKGEVEPFSLGEFVVGVVGDVIDYIKSFFSFEGGLFGNFKLPNFSDLFMNLVGGMLPSPDGFIGKLLYKIPGTDVLEQAARAFGEGGKFVDGQFVMPGEETALAAAGDDTATAQSMTEKRKEELRANERLMNILGKYDEDTFIEGGTTTVEAKLFELEMRNEELRRMLENTDIRNEDSAAAKAKALNAGSGNPMGTGGVVINDMSNNSTTNATADTYNNMDISADHSDPVSKIADNVAVAPMFR